MQSDEYKKMVEEMWGRFTVALDGRSLRRWADANGFNYNRLQVQYYQQKMPNAFDIYAYSKALGVSFAWLLYGTEPSKEEKLLLSLERNSRIFNLSARLLDADIETLAMVDRILAGGEKK